ncbi:hypothetical protein TRFO_41844 [Tritrichomonas foetus]|uniref:Uncharacterized protein n=1 Tax=Tritrichomonas foetus TaxID=1144522 RepID=A0A1J4KYL0_9EUKA|nr:hypothetical protein TRFO_41844 [Tritrichomonas foetus]|eukprot:OHT16347.1 hypothetical protein TRFO_41844 [Tritrichomonas foetus]
MSQEDESDINPHFYLFPFADDVTFVCGSCFAHRNYVHFTGGYNFKDLMERKYRPTASNFDSLIGQHTAIKYKDGKLRHRVEDLSYSRVVGGTCVFAEATETAYCFGGIHEEIGIDSDPNTLFVSNLLVTHKFREKMSSTRTFVTPVGVVHPPARVFHCSAFDNDRNSVWIYGGGTVAEKDKSTFNDLWEYQTQTQIWTLHEIEKPLKKSNRWGQNLVYFDKKLILLGGNDRTAQKNLWILDLTDTKNLQWKTIHIPDKVKLQSMGCSMQLVHHPTLGPQILIIGGCYDAIYKSLGFSVDLLVEQSPKNLFPLKITAFDPLRRTFTKIKVPKSIPNVSYHGTALINENLFLVGGLNHCDEGRAFCKNIIVIDIFHYLDETYQSKVVYNFDYPIDNLNQRVFSVSFPELKRIISDELEKVRENSRLKLFKRLYNQHTNCPYPTNEFTLIHNQFCHNLIIRQRIGTEPLNLDEIPSCFAKDFVCYLYTGMIHESSKFVDFISFIKFLTFCWKLKLIRLMLLEICCHIENLLPEEVLKIAALTLDNVTPLVDQPQFDIMKYVLFSVLRTTGSSLRFDTELYLISHYLIPLLESNPQYPSIDISELPSSTVIYDLSLLMANSTLQCQDYNLRIDSSMFSMNPSVVETCPPDVVIAVVKLSLVPLLEDINKIISAFILINSFKTELTKPILMTILNDSFKQIEVLLINEPQFKQAILEFMPSIQHKSLLELCVRFIGHDCTTFLLNREGKQLKFNLNYSTLYKKFAWIQLDLSYTYLNVLAYLIYTNLTISDIRVKYPSIKLAKALLSVCGDHPTFLPIPLFEDCLSFIRNVLINKENITNAFIIKYFVRLFNIGLIDEISNMTKVEEWIDFVTCYICESQAIAAWYLTKRQSVKSPGSSPNHSSSELSQPILSVNI